MRPKRRPKQERSTTGLVRAFESSQRERTSEGEKKDVLANLAAGEGGDEMLKRFLSRSGQRKKKQSPDQAVRFLRVRASKGKETNGGGPAGGLPNAHQACAALFERGLIDGQRAGV